VVAGSGARRATVVQQHATRAGLGAPDVLVHGEAVFRGSPCYLHDKQHATRAGLGAPNGLELCKDGFRGNGWFVGNV
jgi:hypothetical protein